MIPPERRSPQLQYYYDNRDKCLTRTKTAARSMRARLHDMLGNKCAECPVVRNLHMHHVRRDGAACRAKYGNSYTHLKHHVETGTERVNSDLRLLCISCHVAAHGGDWAGRRRRLAAELNRRDLT